MKYTIENNIINISDELIKEYKIVTGADLRFVNIKAMYQKAIYQKANNKIDIEKSVANQIKEEIAVYKNPEFIFDAFRKGIKS